MIRRWLIARGDVYLGATGWGPAQRAMNWVAESEAEAGLAAFRKAWEDDRKRGEDLHLVGRTLNSSPFEETAKTPEAGSTLAKAEALAAAAGTPGEQAAAEAAAGRLRAGLGVDEVRVVSLPWGTKYGTPGPMEPQREGPIPSVSADMGRYM